MDRRVALVTLWAAFAIAAVGVGFGAAGLVGGPFSDGVADAAGIDPGGRLTELPGASPSPEPSLTPPAPPAAATTATPTPATTPDSGPASTGTPARTGRARAASTRPVPVRSVTRSITTRGGLVSAACRSDGFVQVSGSPAVGWEIEDIDAGAQRDAQVRFGRRDGESQVEVEARCWRGAPRFALDDDDGGGGGDGDDGGGGDGDDDDDDDEDSSSGDERED